MLGSLIDQDKIRMLNYTRDAAGGRLYKSANAFKDLVFISHRQSDAKTARELAFFLRSVGVDVYIEALAPISNRDPSVVTDVIDFGLNACSHLIAIISNNTRGSWWVPYEIGIAKHRPVPYGLLVLDNVTQLPEYLANAPIIKDNYELINWTKNFKTRTMQKSAYEIDIQSLPRLRNTNPSFTLTE
ncbi:hypothetical protein GCM10008019_41140 [Deinococcus soli (ex Cha et al. 2016)]|nr:hypothetical protein GCM10008019_41140 [Deinococcus soli (ex Cha et al. 2016)]